MSGPVAGGLAGLLLVVGCWVVLRHLPLRRSASLDARVGPYLTSPGAGPGAGGRAAAGLPARALVAAAAVLGGWLGSTAVVTARVRVLDAAADAGQHRAQQVLWALAGGLLAGTGCWVLLAGPAATAGATTTGPGVAAAVLAGALAGALARDQVLLRAVRRRRAEVEEDLPVVAELLALSVGAGENVGAAVRRVAQGGGPLRAELRGALADVRTGTPLLSALTATADRLGVVSFGRFVDGIAVAVESGSPLADVLRAQAADARDAERRRLVEAGGRKEVQMMVPVVFGVLPVTVVFAVYPGLAQLSLGP